jgi:hypothetical protein
VRFTRVIRELCEWMTAGPRDARRGLVVGDSKRSADARRAATPVLESRVWTYTIAAVALLVLALAAPLFARGWLMSLVLIGLAVLGIEFVRTTVLRQDVVPIPDIPPVALTADEKDPTPPSSPQT